LNFFKGFKMLEGFIHAALVLIIGLLFGGMLLFSAGFAALLFKYLPPADARMLIRKAFPPFYLFVIIASGLAAILSWSMGAFITGWMVFILLTSVLAKQVLMPAINLATDSGRKSRFNVLHSLSVLLTLAHIVISAVVLVQITT
jgi:hypothetical protein